MGRIAAKGYMAISWGTTTLPFYTNRYPLDFLLNKYYNIFMLNKK